ncbi:MAG TPA: serine/threonine-protein kinase [Gemmatimonadales bacterium]|nr:serine/threonine-protein kinase [Gemmatimonadales bacterium]
MTDPLAILREALAGQYAVERMLGQGGMATVYLAQDLKHDRLVAVKVLNPEISSSLGSDRFLQEIRLAAKLQHPHILGVYDSGAAGGLLYYVMPFVEGESLRDRLNRETLLPLDEAVQLAREIADALGYAHSHGVVHRDIKPENVLLSGGHAMVADFGIARAVSQSGPDRLTQTGTSIGTPAYMSPEQAVGDGSIDGRSDIYSLGCVLYEMLSGRPPFTGPSASAIMAQHSMEIVPSLQIVRQSIPDELEDAVLHALEKVPADRFATASQFAKALSTPGSSTTSPRLSRQRLSRAAPMRGHGPRRHYLRWGIIAAVPLLVAAGWLWTRRGRSAGSAAAAQALRSIAVLYFDDLSNNHEMQHVADGFTDALIHDLSGIDALTVISRNGVLPFKGKAIAPDSIGRVLGVGTLVDGTIEERGDQLRLTVSLINAANGKEIASRTMERPRAEMLALQDDLANQVSMFLRQRLGQEIQVQQRQAETSKVAAWEAFQRGQELLDDVDPLVASGDVPGASARLRAADSVFTEVEELDSRWLRPIVSRGWVAYRQARTGAWDRDAMHQWLDQSIGHADRALKQRPGDAEALELSGTVRYFVWLLNLEPDPARSEALLKRAEADLRAAVAADPGRAVAWASLSHMLLSQSQSAEGKLAALKAYEADPYLTQANLIVWRIFNGSFDLGDKVESRHWCEEGQRRFPDDAKFQECQLMVFAFEATPADIPRAWAAQKRMEELSPASQKKIARHKGQMMVAIALARAGLDDSARAVATAARASADVDPTRDVALWEAIARTFLNDKDEALHQLGQYLAANPQRREFMAKDEGWYFANLKGDPRFTTLIGKPR